MKVVLESDNPMTDDAIQQATGKTFAEWFAEVESIGPARGRRDVIQELYNQMGRSTFMWWATTIWVEYELAKGIVNKKDGLGDGYNICVTKTISAPVDSIYDAFTSGTQDWLGASPAALDAPYTDDGGNTGTWTRLRPGKDVRLVWQTPGVPNPTTVDISFADKGGGKTGIIISHARIQTRAESDGLRNAWTAALDRLKTKLES